MQMGNGAFRRVLACTVGFYLGFHLECKLYFMNLYFFGCMPFFNFLNCLDETRKFQYFYVYSNCRQWRVLIQ